MKINKISSAKIKIRPTEKKKEKAREAADQFKNLPKEMPIEKDVYIKSDADIFEEAKNRILISINNMIMDSRSKK